MRLNDLAIAIMLILSPSYTFAKGLSLKVDIDHIRFAGEFDREEIRRSISAHKSKLESCTSSQPSPDYSVEFQIDQNGRVRALANNGYPLPSDSAMECLSKALGEIRFSIPRSDSTDSVILPIKIEALGGGKSESDKEIISEQKNKGLVESEADRRNREYLESIKAKALRSMNAQNAKQNAQLKATLSCNDAYAKDRLLEKYDRCLVKAKLVGVGDEPEAPGSMKNCHRSCDVQRTNLEVRCQKCTGSYVTKQNCVSSCQKDISEKIDSCKLACR